MLFPALLLLLIHLLALGLAQLLDLEEGEACRRWWGAEWTCRKVTDCPEVGDIRSRRPVMCGFQGRLPIVCCPPSATGHRHSTKAKEYCEKIQSTCGGKKRVSVRPLGNKRPWGKWGGGGGERWNGGGWGPPAPPAFAWRSRYKRQGTDFTEDERPSIIGGEYSFARTRPYMALIGYGAPDDKQWNCGGSLISEKFVLSAAHCSESQTQGPAKWVLLGELDLSTTKDDARPELFDIARRVVHPEYKQPAIYNDLALFELDREVKLSQWIRPVCLHSAGEIHSPKATATGWGRTDFVGDTSPQLMEVNLSLVNGEECRELLKNVASNRIPEGIDLQKMICAGEKEGGKDTCAGDSGGPLVIRKSGTCLYSQVGVTSFGRQCGLPDSPGVYTRISFFVPWIESVVWP